MTERLRVIIYRLGGGGGFGASKVFSVMTDAPKNPPPHPPPPSRTNLELRIWSSGVQASPVALFA